MIPMFEDMLTTCVAGAAVIIAASLAVSYFIICRDHKNVVKYLSDLRDVPSKNPEGKEKP